MCIPELIFFDDDSHNRHSRRGGNAFRPLSVDSDAPPPLLSSPPFVVHVSPKIGHHHHASIRHQPARRNTAPLPAREREEVDWREGFRAGRESAQKREVEDRKRTVVMESKPTAKVPEMIITAATPTKGTDPGPSATPKPAKVEIDVTVQPPLQRTVSAPQPSPTPIRETPSSATVPAPVQPPAGEQEAKSSKRSPHPQPRRRQQQDEGDRSHVYEHKRYYRGKTHHSPSTDNDSSSSRSLRGLRRRISNVWSHVAGLERWAMDEDTRARQARQNRERREVEDIRRAREREAAEETRRQRRRRTMRGRGVRFEDDEYEYDERERRRLNVPRRMQRVVVIDERDRDRARARGPLDAWAASRWNWERGL